MRSRVPHGNHPGVRELTPELRAVVDLAGAAQGAYEVEDLPGELVFPGEEDLVAKMVEKRRCGGEDSTHSAPIKLIVWHLRRPGHPSRRRSNRRAGLRGICRLDGQNRKEFAKQPELACAGERDRVEFRRTRDLWPLAAETAKEPTSRSLVLVSDPPQSHVRPHILE